MNLQRAMLLAAAFAPACAVLLARTVAPHAGPATAVAKPVAPERIEPVRPRSTPQLMGKQAALAAALRSRDAAYTSPFVVPMSEAAREGLLQDPKLAGQASKRPEYIVSSIISGAQPMAVINGKRVRVGGEMEGGWSLLEVDAAKRQVTIQHAEHGRMVLHIKTQLE